MPCECVHADGSEETHVSRVLDEVGGRYTVTKTPEPKIPTMRKTRCVISRAAHP